MPFHFLGLGAITFDGMKVLHSDLFHYILHGIPHDEIPHILFIYIIDDGVIPKNCSFHKPQFICNELHSTHARG